MTPQEKAYQLVERYTNMDFNFNSYSYDKRCALIAIDEILQLRKGYFDCINPMQDEKYWQEVKQEIENL
jgi:hypothetical protein